MQKREQKEKWMMGKLEEVQVHGTVGTDERCKEEECGRKCRQQKQQVEEVKRRKNSEIGLGNKMSKVF